MMPIGGACASIQRQKEILNDDDVFEVCLGWSKGTGIYWALDTLLDTVFQGLYHYSNFKY